tara:strand:+ start:598 stop:705 length:108 start_codon:yes stop_codon:yes gene_type:complete
MLENKVILAFAVFQWMNLKMVFFVKLPVKNGKNLF